MEKIAQKRTNLEKFIRALARRLSINSPSKSLQSWHILTYAQFPKELKKLKVTLSLPEEAEWEDYFESEIERTNREKDRLVYALTEEEIKIEEGG